MHSPSLHPSPWSWLQTLKHIPQFIGSHCVLTQTPSQTSSPGSLHSPPVVIVVVPVPGSSVVPPVSPVVDVSLAEDDDVSSEVVDVLPGVVVVGSELDDEVDVVGSDDVASEDDDCPFVLDIESIPVDAAVIESPVVDPPVSPPSLPQAHRARPTSVEITIGAAASTEQEAEQKGQRRSLSRTKREQLGQRCTRPPYHTTTGGGVHETVATVARQTHRGSGIGAPYGRIT